MRYVIWFTVFALVCLGIPASAQECAKLDCTPRIAVMSAFGAEMTNLLAVTDIEEVYVLNGRSFTTGVLEGNDAVLFLTGVSMINAAMNTQLALDHFNITHIAFSGISGGVSPDVNIGDVYVADQWAQYQEMIYVRDEVNIDEEYPGAPHYGFMVFRPVSVTRNGGPVDETEKVSWFVADPEMFVVAQTALAGVELKQCTAENVCLTEAPKIIMGGNAVAGQTFLDNADYRQSYAWEGFQALGIDMESSAVAHVAYVNAVPFIVFRSASDLAGGGPGQNEIGTFFQLASDNSAAVYRAFLRAWAAH